MKIGIDARLYGKHSRGIGRYIAETIKQLEKLDTVNTYVIFLHKHNFNEYTPANPNFIKVHAPWHWYSLAEQLFLPFLLYKHKLDLVHFPHFNVPLLYRKPFITTIHDLILIKDTQERATTLGPIIYAMKKFFYKIIIKNAVISAQKVIAISQNTKTDIMEELGIQKEKIEMIYEGVTPLEQAENKLDSDPKFRYNKSNYLIYVGSAYPHKNLEFLIKVVQRYNEDKNDPLQLLLVGKTDFFYTRLKDETTSTYVHFLGYVPDQELVPLLKNALAYVFPSRYEGFGLPPLEAMMYGCPVLSSNSSCLPEVLGNAAHYFNPLDENSLITAITDIVEQPELRETLINRGYKQIHKYSWETSTQLTHQTYEQTVHGRPKKENKTT